MLKRIFDFVVSLIGLILLTPFFIITGLLIKLLMHGPVFYVQNRIGREGIEFRLLKFRSMDMEPKTIKDSFDLGNKSRITSFGRFLRKTKIDELPQLYNVFIGDMSFVGPRPEVKKWTEVYPEKWAKIHIVKPGITDNASIEFRNEEEFLSHSPDPKDTYRNVILPRKLDLYIEYVNNHTFFGDILIILRTINAVLFR